MPEEHIVHVIKKVRIIVTVLSHLHGKAELRLVYDHYASIYDGGTHLRTIYGRGYDETLNKAVRWVFENFSVPDSISMSVRQELPKQVIEYFDKQTRLRQRFVEEEE